MYEGVKVLQPGGYLCGRKQFEVSMAGKDETTLDTIRHLKRQEPFVPFRIVLSSGDRYVIENPDALAIASSQLHYYPRTGMGIHLRLNQIAAVEVESQKPAA